MTAKFFNGPQRGAPGCGGISGADASLSDVDDVLEESLGCDSDLQDRLADLMLCPRLPASANGTSTQMFRAWGVHARSVRVAQEAMFELSIPSEFLIVNLGPRISVVMGDLRFRLRLERACETEAQSLSWGRFRFKSRCCLGPNLPLPSKLSLTQVLPNFLSPS